MLRIALLLILFVLLARAFWRVVDNIIEAAGGQPRGRRSAANVPQSRQMARDPVCGTFVLPERAISIPDGRGRVYFCSDACRDTYRARAGRTA